MFIEPIPEDQIPGSEKNRGYLFGVLFAYSVLLITGILFHPMWRDEFHTWSIAGASGSFRELMRNKAAEGHPDLWYLLVYGIRKVSDNPLSMQLMHAGFAILTVFLVLKYAPFTRLRRVLLVFGYFYLFEYAVISRNYAIGILLVTIYLALYRHRVRFLLVMALVLFLMAQTNVYGIILSMTFLATWVFEAVFSEVVRKELGLQKPTVFMGLMLVMAGIAYCIHSVIPPPTGYFAGSSHFSLSQLTLHETIRSVATLWQAWFPVPILNSEFWETNIVRDIVVQAILSLVLAWSAALLFTRRPVVFFLYITGVAGIIAFILMYYYGYIRHHGHLFILLVICLWLSAYYREGRYTNRYPVIEKFRGWLIKNTPRIFTVMLSIQLFAGVYAFTVQCFVPFSAARATAHYIRQQRLDRFLIAGDQDVALEPVLGYLKKDAFFFSRNAVSTYLVYDAVRRIPGHERVLALADSLVVAHGDTILLVMNYPLAGHPGRNLFKVGSFEKSIRYDEIYYLYLLSPPAGSLSTSTLKQRITKE